MRALIIIALALSLAGCATTQRSSSRAAHSTASVNYTPYNVQRYAAPQAEEEPIENVVMAQAQTVPGGAFHTVKPGETLWSISKMYNVSLESMAAANSITDPSDITKGQVLKIPRPAATVRPAPYKPNVRLSLAWPVRGRVISRFGEKIDGAVNKGIDISAAQGAEVVAAKDGRVVYCDSYFKGFGQTVIIDHSDGYQTVYSYNSEILVKTGDAVRQDEAIARAGQSGRAKEPMLHFEIRRNGEPQDPQQYLSQ